MKTVLDLILAAGSVFDFVAGVDPVESEPCAKGVQRKGSF